MCIMGYIIWDIMLLIGLLREGGIESVMRMLSIYPFRRGGRLICRSSTLDEVLTEGARGVFMLMYELVQPDLVSERVGRRDVSTAPSVDTLDTVAASTSTVHEEEPVLEPIEDGGMTKEDVSMTSTERRPSLQLGPIPSATGADPSLLDIVESRLEAIKISPTSSVTSTSISDTDSIAVPDEKSRSTSFSSTHSRPRTPIFENKDPQLSPPPRKKVRIQTMGDVEDMDSSFALESALERDGTH